MIPLHVWYELFETYGALSPTTREFITEFFEGYGCEAEAITEDTTEISAQFSSVLGLNGTLSIDRIKKTYSLHTRSGWSGDKSSKIDGEFKIEDIAQNLRRQVIEADRRSMTYGSLVEDKNVNIDRRYRNLHDNAKAALDVMRKRYGDGQGPYLFAIKDISVPGLDSDAIDKALGMLLSAGFISRRGDDVILDRTKADSLRQ